VYATNIVRNSGSCGVVKLPMALVLLARSKCPITLMIHHSVAG